MRRFALATVAGLLVLSACSTDNSSPAPTEPGSEAVTAARCRPAPFPIADLTKQIIKIFPVQGGLQAQALVRVVTIGALWTVCKPTDAQKGAGAFVAWMADLYQRGKLGSASAQQVSNLTIALLKAVGLTVPPVPPTTTSPGDFGAGVFIGPTLTITTLNRLAGTQLPAGSFPLGTVITLQKLPDSPAPISGNVEPPFYEINAAIPNSTSHTLLDDKVAIVGFCVADGTLGNFGTPAIAHGLSEGFEVLPLTDTGPLGLDCDPLPVPDFSVRRLSLTNWRDAGRTVGVLAKALFLPQAAQAAAIPGKSGLGGLARSLSPFGVTEGASNTLEFAPDLNNAEQFRDPSERSFALDGTEAKIEWCDGIECFTPNAWPGVILRDGEGTPIEDAPVQVTLIRGSETSTGNLTEGSTTTVNTNSDASNDNVAIGEALFDNLFVENIPGCSGTYRLEFTAAGAEPLESGSFEVINNESC